MGTHRSVAAMLRDRVEATPDRDAFYAPADGEWKTYTWIDVYGHVTPIAAGLRALGLQRGDRVALLCSTR